MIFDSFIQDVNDECRETSAELREKKLFNLNGRDMEGDLVGHAQCFQQRLINLTSVRFDHYERVMTCKKRLSSIDHPSLLKLVPHQTS